MYKEISVAIVAGMGANTRAIGKENGLLWHIPSDMKRFKSLTLGKPVIMGRKTFESIVAILGQPLPNRTNIVITRNPDYAYPGATTATSLAEALTIAAAEEPTEIHIGGGEEIYRQSLPLVDRLYLTLIHDDKAGDAFFPEFETDFIEVSRTVQYTTDGMKYDWVEYVRKNVN